MVGRRGLNHRVMTSMVLVLLASALLLFGGEDRNWPVQSGPPSLSAVHLKRSSSAIALSADGATLLVVNPDSNSLTLVDTASHVVLAELPVGLDPRTVAVDDAGQRAYVANRGGDSISVVDLAMHQVNAVVNVGYHPYGIVTSPSGDRVYVAEQGADRVSALDVETMQVLASVPVADRPSGLAISADGRTLYVTHLLSNTVSVLGARLFTLYFPAIVRETGASAYHDAMHHHRASLAPRIAQGLLSQSSSIRLWPDSNLVQSIVLSPDGARAYVPHTRSNTANRALTFDTTVFPLVSLIRE